MSCVNICLNHIHLHSARRAQKHMCMVLKGLYTVVRTEKMTHAREHRHLLQRASHMTYYIHLQTCKSQMHAQLRGRMQRERVHESSSEISLAHRGCFVFPARDARCFAEAGSALGLMKSSILVMKRAFSQSI